MQLKTFVLRAVLCTSATWPLATATSPAWSQNAANQNAQTLKNPGFEGDYALVNPTSDSNSAKAKIAGQVASGWNDNSDWADVGIDYSRDTLRPHRGKSSQRVSVSRVTGGAGQFVQPVKFQKGHVYRFSVWLRGRAGQVVTLYLRQSGAPYNAYGEMRASLTPEWQQYTVAGQANEETDGFLMLRVAAPTTYSVDDAEFEDLTNAVTTGAARVGNLLAGGEFEVAQPFGWNARLEGSPQLSFDDPRPQWTTDAVQGRGAWKLTLPQDVGNASVQPPIAHLNFGRAHTVSAWMKADTDGAGAYWTLEGTDLNQGFALTTAWKRYSWTFTPPFQTFSRLRFGFSNSQQKRTVFLDGFMLEEAATASESFAPSAPLSLGLTLAKPGHVVFPGEVALRQLQTAGVLPRGAKLSLQVTEVNGSKRALPFIVLPVIVLPAKAIPIPSMNNRQGIWKLRAQIVGANNETLSSPVELVWARLPRPKNIAPERSFFGVHIPLSARYIAIARALGQRQVRLHDTSMLGKWAIVEPQPGTRLYYDAGVDLARKNGLSILGMLDGAAGWTSTKPRTSEGGYWNIWNIPDKPEARQAWRAYVRDVTGHFKGRIDNWEVWNEPWGAWWINSGNAAATPSLYADLLRDARDEAHAANPNARILGIDTVTGSRDNWTLPTLKAARDNPFDVFSFHDYNDSLYGGPDNIALRDTKRYRADLQTFGRVKPLWNTEGGPGNAGSFYAPETGAIPVAQQAAWSSRFDISYMAAGANVFFIYAVHSDRAFGDPTWSVSEWDDTPKPLLAARAVLANLVDGVAAPTRSQPQAGVDAFTFPNGVRAAWSFDGQEHTLTIPRGMLALDVWGNPMAARGAVKVGEEPIYFVRGSQAALKRAP